MMPRFSPIYLTTLGITCLLCSISTVVQAQSVQADGSVIGTLVTPSSQTFTITGGRQLQQNLFHSFTDFSIPTGSKAVFDLIGNSGVSSIFSRVTGTNISNIDGLIRAVNSSNPVSLFLMNPNGIISGPNARLDIGGSFVGTTASGIQFENGTVFNTATTGDRALLTVTTPVRLQFGTNPSDGFYRFNPLVTSSLVSVTLGSGTSSHIQVKAEQVLLRSGGTLSFSSLGCGIPKTTSNDSNSQRV